MNTKAMEWVLRIAVAGEFFGHGMFAFNGKEQWIGWMQQLTGVDTATAIMLLTFVGLMDILVALIVLFKPVRVVFLWAALWGFWTAILRPIVGEPIWDFVERWANWGAPLALLLMRPWPRSFKEWFN
jgi:hypothetical protein